MTRIPSLFNLLMRVGFAVLLLGAYHDSQAQEVIWDRSGAEYNSHYGYYVFALGDQNDDGFADWGVGSFAGRADQPNASVVELFHGGNPPSQQPYMIFMADPEIHFDQLSGMSAGDMNGDGYIDWIVGVRYNTNVQYVHYQLYCGGPEADQNPEAVFVFRVLPIDLGQWIRAFGDFNGDGFDDIYRYDVATDNGFAFWGSSDVDTVSDWQNLSSPEGLYWTLPYATGDLNGDGYTDYLSGNNNESMKIFWGSANPGTIPGQYVMGAGGSAEAIVQDLNDDGVNDLVTASQSTVKVHFGRDSIHAAPDGLCTFPGVAYSAHSLGDINDDGHGDFGIVDIGIGNSGRLSVYLGYHWINPNPFLSFSDYAEPLELVNIWTCAGLGDVNGDGVDDFIIGAQGGDTEGQRGRAVVIAGSRNWIVPANEYIIPFPMNFALSAYPNPFNSATTLKLNLPINTRTANLTVTNVLGQTVDHQELNILSPQTEIQLTANNWPSGIYFAQIQTPTQSQTTKLVLLK